jgi:surfeit locus 1 family protein
MLRLRPYPGFTLFTAISVALLCGLGVWQVQRLHWKLDLIAMMNRNMRIRPIAFDAGGKMIPEIYNQYDHVTGSGHFDNAKETYLFATGAGGGEIFHVLTPFTTVAGQTFLVDRGVVPREKLDPASRRAGQLEGVVRVTGIWRWPDAPGPFTPKPDLAHRVWYAHDMTAIAAFDRVKLADTAVIEADATPNPGGWPKGGQTVVDLPNNHLSYAATWFGLAVGLLGVWLAYHISKGRLAWARRQSYKPPKRP